MVNRNKCKTDEHGQWYMVGLRASGSWVGNRGASSVATWWRAGALLAFPPCYSSLVECHRGILIHVNMYLTPIVSSHCIVTVLIISPTSWTRERRSRTIDTNASLDTQEEVGSSITDIDVVITLSSSSSKSDFRLTFHVGLLGTSFSPGLVFLLFKSK